MPNTREVRRRIRSVKNIAQVTRALQAVSAIKVRQAMQALDRTQPYATKAWQVLTHLAAQPGHTTLHPLLAHRPVVKNVLVVLISGDRGLAGAYNTNIVRYAMQKFEQESASVHYITVGRKGRDLIHRRRKNIVAEFINLPATPSFPDVSAIGRLAVEEFLQGRADRVYLVYTDFISIIKQIPNIKLLLPLELGAEAGEGRVMDYGAHPSGPAAAYIYEPGESEILDEAVPRFTALQLYQALLESLASEHAARMIAMQNATDNATDLVDTLTMDYNQLRQKNITAELIDLVGGTEALTTQSHGK
jgi:F-type H+-transporting ATPase subunit gamma